jgi:hypothetical protein
MPARPRPLLLTLLIVCTALWIAQTGIERGARNIDVAPLLERAGTLAPTPGGGLVDLLDLSRMP